MNNSATKTSPAPELARRTLWHRIEDAVFGYDFFVSYSHSDGEHYAHKLVRRLQDGDYVCFLDRQDYSKGDDWEQVGAWAIRRTAVLVLVGTPKTHTSAPVLQEVRIFASSGRKIIPIEFNGSLSSNAPIDSPLLPYVHAAVLTIREGELSESSAPSDSTITEIHASFHATRQRVKRRRWAQGLVAVLTVLLIVAFTQWGRAVAAQKRESLQLARASWLLADASEGTSFIQATFHLLRAAAAYSLGGDRESAQNAAFAAQLRSRALIATLLHDGPALGATMSPDGQRVVTWGGGGQARLWSANGEPIGRPMVSKADFVGARFSTDGRRFVTWDASFTLNVGDAYDGRAIGQSIEHESNKAEPGGADLSMDGRRLVSWEGFSRRSRDGDTFTVKTWDADTGRSLGQVVHKNIIGGATFSPDGKSVLSWSGKPLSSKGGNLLLWDVISGKPVAPEMSHPFTEGARFSPDGKYILSWRAAPGGLPEVGKALLWNARDGHLVGTPMKHGSQSHSLKGAEFSPDGQHVLTWGGDNAARLWKIPDVKQVHSMQYDFPRSGESSFRARLSLDGHKVLTWRDNWALLWNTDDGRQISSELEHTAMIAGVAFTSDSQRVLTWCLDNTMRLWNTQDGTLIGSPSKFESSANPAFLSVDGQSLLIWDKGGGGWNGLNAQLMGAVNNIPARLWSAGGEHLIGRPLRFLPLKPELVSIDGASVTGPESGPAPGTNQETVESANFTSDGTEVVAWSANGLTQRWSTSTGEAIGLPRFPLTPYMSETLYRGAYDLVLSPDSRWAIFLHASGRAILWNGFKTVALSERLIGNSMSIPRPRFGPDSTRLMLEGGRYLLDMNSGQIIGEQFNDAVDGRFSPDGRWILTWPGDESSAQLRDARSGQLLWSMDNGVSVEAVEFSPRGNVVLLWETGDNVTLRLLSTATGRLVGQTMQVKYEVVGARVSVTGERVLSWSRDSSGAFLWDPRAGITLWQRKGINGATFSPDGKTFAAWGGKRVILGDAETGAAIGSPMRHARSEALFSVDGSRLLSWGGDGKVCFWDTRSTKQIGCLQHTALVVDAKFNQEETRVLTTTSDGESYLWDTGFDWRSPIERRVLEFEVRSGAKLDLDGEVRLLSVAEWEHKKTELSHMESASGRTVSSPGIPVVVGGATGTERTAEP